MASPTYSDGFREGYRKGFRHGVNAAHCVIRASASQYIEPMSQDIERELLGELERLAAVAALQGARN